MAAGMIRPVPDSAGFDERPVRAFRPDPGRPADPDRWPATVPAVAQLLRDGLDLPAGLTVLVGENGSGKSTVLEILAEACGLNPQGGSALAQFRTPDSEPGLGSHFVVERGVARSRWSYFLRADTMHGLYTFRALGVGTVQSSLDSRLSSGRFVAGWPYTHAMKWKCPSPDCPPTDIAPVEVTAGEDEVRQSVCGGSCGRTYPTAGFRKIR
jgi:hypothetical protein